MFLKGLETFKISEVDSPKHPKINFNCLPSLIPEKFLMGSIFREWNTQISLGCLYLAEKIMRI